MSAGTSAGALTEASVSKSGSVCWIFNVIGRGSGNVSLRGSVDGDSTLRRSAGRSGSVSGSISGSGNGRGSRIH